MPQQFGLGRGLASLIPPKKSNDASASPPSSSKLGAPLPSDPNASPFLGLSPTPSSASMVKPLQKLSLTQEKSEESFSPDIVPPKKVSAAPVKNSPQTVKVSEEKEKAKLPVSSLAEGEMSENGQSVLSVPTESIVPNPHQPRIQFSEEKLMELAQSIREHGILQPLIVTRASENTYELIAGERRLQAAKIVGLKTVPVLLRSAENREKLELAIIENIQRHDLNPIEEARAYRRLSEEFTLSQEDIAKKMGRSRSSIANTLRLLQLPADIQRAVSDEKISEGHAKALLSIENPEKQRALFEMIVAHGLTVREAERKSREVSTHLPKKMTHRDPDLEARESALSEAFGTKVRIAKSGLGGVIRIEYFSDEEFRSLFSKLTGQS